MRGIFWDFSSELSSELEGLVAARSLGAILGVMLIAE